MYTYSMDEITKRIYYLKGSPREVGFIIGQTLGKRLEDNIDRYIQSGPAKYNFIDIDKLHKGAIPWLHSLPQRFQDEIDGIAIGANIPVQRLAEWFFIDRCVNSGCTGIIYRINNQTWVARNNDLWAPELWGYACVRGIEGRIPSISFGLEGDVFTSTGINHERLWLHFNYLPVHDESGNKKPHLATHVWLTEALETCRTLKDVEYLLSEVERENGMILFAIDGKTDDFAVFECACSSYKIRSPIEDWIAGTNHCCTDIEKQEQDDIYDRSVLRLKRVESLLSQLSASEEIDGIYIDLRHILADAEVEARGDKYFTVFSNVVCPSYGKIWYTFGEYPAASNGRWHQITWPW